jgi:hypothetical protein
MLYELWNGVDEYFIDIDENKHEKKKHYEYFQNGKFIKKYKKFVNKVCNYVLEHNQINSDEIEEFRQLLYVFVNDIPGNQDCDNSILENYGYKVYPLNIYTIPELEIIELLKYDDLKSKHFDKSYQSKQHYIYELLNKFIDLDL